MKQWAVVIVLGGLLAGMCALPVFAQGTGTVKGVCKDVQGQPIAGAIVQYVGEENGHKYEIKTNSKGEYVSLGIGLGKYTVKLLKDGKELYSISHFPVALDENVLDFDLKKEQVKQAQGQGLTPEQLKQIEEQKAKEEKETNVLKLLNDKLAAGDTASKAGDYDTAINVLTEATQLDATRDVLWAHLADAYRGSAVKQTDAGEKSKRFEAAVADYQKAVDIKQKAMETGVKKPEDVKVLAAYYNNEGDAAGKAGKTDDAIKAYTQAGQVNPEGAAGYYFNIGAVLTNANRVDEAIAAFDKALAADPNRADAYYWKGVNLVSKATTGPTGKVVPAPGTVEALNKYLELQPQGPYAEGAKGMLQYVGSTIEVNYGQPKKKPPVKNK